MAINQNFPTLNEIDPSYADIGVTFSVTGGDLIDMADIAGIKWDRKVEVGKRKGASGGRVMARTTGEVSYSASMSLYRAGLDKLKIGLIAKAPTRGNQKLISLVTFDIMIIHSPPLVEGAEEKLYKTKIKGCRYLGDADDMKEGPDADQIEVTLDPIEIVNIINGEEVALL